MKDYEEYQLSLQFLKEIVILADMCIDRDADRVKFEIGPLDGIAMEVSIEFHFKEV